MNKVLTIVLILWFMEIGLMNISYAKEEKNPTKIENAATTGAVSQTLKPQTTDILSGKPIKKSIYTDYKGKRIYFCCDEGRKNFNNDPEKHIKAFQDQGITLEDVPAKK